MRLKTAYREILGAEPELGTGPLGRHAGRLLAQQDAREAEATQVDRERGFRASAPMLDALRTKLATMKAEASRNDLAPVGTRREVWAALQTAKKDYPSDQGLRMATAHTYRWLDKDPEGFVCVADLERLRNHYQSQFPRSVLASVIDQAVDTVAFSHLDTNMLTTVACRVNGVGEQRQASFEEAITDAGLLGPQHRRARDFVRYLSEVGDASSQEELMRKVKAQSALEDDAILGGDDLGMEEEPHELEEPHMEPDEGGEGDSETVTSPNTGEEFVLEVEAPALEGGMDEAPLDMEPMGEEPGGELAPALPPEEEGMGMGASKKTAANEDPMLAMSDPMFQTQLKSQGIMDQSGKVMDPGGLQRALEARQSQMPDQPGGQPPAMQPASNMGDAGMSPMAPVARTVTALKSRYIGPDDVARMKVIAQLDSFVDEEAMEEPLGPEPGEGMGDSAMGGETTITMADPTDEAGDATLEITIRPGDMGPGDEGTGIAEGGPVLPGSDEGVATEGGTPMTASLTPKMARWVRLGHGRVENVDAGRAVVRFGDPKTAAMFAKAFDGGALECRAMVDCDHPGPQYGSVEREAGRGFVTTAAFRKHVKSVYGRTGQFGPPGLKTFAVHAVRMGEKANKPIERIVARTMLEALKRVAKRLSDVVPDAGSFKVMANEDEFDEMAVVVMDDDMGDMMTVEEDGIGAEVDYDNGEEPSMHGDEDDSVEVWVGEADDGFYYKLDENGEGGEALEEGPFSSLEEAKDEGEAAAGEWTDEMGVPDHDLDEEEDSDDEDSEDSEQGADEIVDSLLEGDEIQIGACKIATNDLGDVVTTVNGTQKVASLADVEEAVADFVRVARAQKRTAAAKPKAAQPVFNVRAMFSATCVKCATRGEYPMPDKVADISCRRCGAVTPGKALLAQFAQKAAATVPGYVLELTIPGKRENRRLTARRILRAIDKVAPTSDAAVANGQLRFAVRQVGDRELSRIRRVLEDVFGARYAMEPPMMAPSQPPPTGGTPGGGGVGGGPTPAGGVQDIAASTGTEEQQKELATKAKLPGAVASRKVAEKCEDCDCSPCECDGDDGDKSKKPWEKDAAGKCAKCGTHYKKGATKCGKCSCKIPSDKDASRRAQVDLDLEGPGDDLDPEPSLEEAEDVLGPPDGGADDIANAHLDPESEDAVKAALTHFRNTGIGISSAVCEFVRSYKRFLDQYGDETSPQRHFTEAGVIRIAKEVYEAPSMMVGREEPMGASRGRRFAGCKKCSTLLGSLKKEAGVRDIFSIASRVHKEAHVAGRGASEFWSAKSDLKYARMIVAADKTHGLGEGPCPDDMDSAGNSAQHDPASNEGVSTTDPVPAMKSGGRRRKRRKRADEMDSVGNGIKPQHDMQSSGVDSPENAVSEGSTFETATPSDMQGGSTPAQHSMDSNQGVSMGNDDVSAETPSGTFEEDPGTMGIDSPPSDGQVGVENAQGTSYSSLDSAKSHRAGGSKKKKKKKEKGGEIFEQLSKKPKSGGGNVSGAGDF